jgi:hypothetical protein
MAAAVQGFVLLCGMAALALSAATLFAAFARQAKQRTGA